MTVRSLGTALACVTLSLALTACGGETTDDTEVSPTTTTTSSSPTTSTATPTDPAATDPASTRATAVPKPDAPPAATYSARPTPTSTAITEEMGPGEHDMDGE